MTIKEGMQNGVAILTLRGNLIGEPETSELKEKIKNLSSGGVKRIVMDMADVTFINSTGLGSLISSLTTVRAAGGDLRLSSVNEKVHNLFVITKLATVFDIHDTLEQAVSSFK
jgi:anti-sigma B factor antagonist